ncbi:MAG TPA: phage tail assembly protein [Pedomonas sp.]|uniref:phage tail assembly protein n=1 Tax=Pedomonas sp. TaxID=2976421 RepID=UPI002F405566
MTQTTSAPVTTADVRTVNLDNPIQRGETAIDTLQLRKPGAGELRGLTIADLARLDVAAILTLLPRITTPPISPAEAAALSIEDLFACSTEVGDFLLQKRDRAAFPRA